MKQRSKQAKMINMVIIFYLFLTTTTNAIKNDSLIEPFDRSAIASPNSTEIFFKTKEQNEDVDSPDFDTEEALIDSLAISNLKNENKREVNSYIIQTSTTPEVETATAPTVETTIMPAAENDEKIILSVPQKVINFVFGTPKSNANDVTSENTQIEPTTESTSTTINLETAVEQTTASSTVDVTESIATSQQLDLTTETNLQETTVNPDLIRETRETINPNKPADPSLETIKLIRPDYRISSSTAIPGTLKPDEKSSSTIMSMNESPFDNENDIVTTTGFTIDPIVVTTTPVTTIEEFTTTFASTWSPQDFTPTKTIPELEITTETPNYDAKSTVVVVDGGADSDTILKALKDAIKDDKLHFQNVTIILPNFNPPPQALFDAILPYREYEDPPQYPQVLGRENNVMFPPNNIFFDPRSQIQRPMPAYQQNQNGYNGFFRDNNYFTQVVPQKPSATMVSSQSRIKVLIEPNALFNKMRGNKRTKLLDASYEPEGNPEDPSIFKELYYANWDELITKKPGAQFKKSHIPDSIHFNLNIATYPAWNDRQALYPADLFEEYVQRLGINRGDEIIVYARGPMGGMLHASRAWALFRIYGHSDVSVLNGGLDAWRRADLPVTNSTVDNIPHGNWTAFFNTALSITFEELTTPQSDGYCVLSRLYWYNYLDARPRNEYFGSYSNRQYESNGRSRIPGTKSFPADELVRDGRLIENSEISKKLQTVNYVSSHQTIVAGNTPDEASLVILALKLVGDETAKLYNGGMEELRRRAPQYISN